MFATMSSSMGAISESKMRIRFKETAFAGHQSSRQSLRTR
jgi:hypothetical protein